MNCLSPIFIALFYIFFSALWIIFSDLLLAEIFKDPEKVLYFQTFKGLVFITVSGILIYILVKSNNVRLKRLRDKLLLAQEQKAAAKKKLLEAQKLEAIGTLSGGIAHDFNNILTGLYGQLELLKNNYGNPEIFFKYINNIIEITDRAKDLVTQILVFSRKKIIPKKPIHAVAVIEEAFNLLRSTLPQSIDIKKEYDSKNDVIMASATQIHQILMNLGTNAYQAMDDKGQLKIGLKNVFLNNDNICSLPEGDYLLLTVEDTGKGIPSEIQSKIFDPFFSLRENGTGLGLALVNGIITSHGGAITLESQLNHGTSFYIYLPLFKGSTYQQVQSLEISEEDLKGSEKILFVDDEEMMREAVEDYFSDLGYQITVVADSKVAIEKLKQANYQFDLIITDMTMPHMNGLEFAHRIKEIKEIPIVLCSGYSELINEENIKQNSIDIFLEKPLKLEEMVRQIRILFAQHHKL